MVSRHGLLPDGARRAELHRLAQPGPHRPGHRRPARRRCSATRSRRRARQGVDWRPVVDGLRAPTQGLWSGSTSTSGGGSSRRTPGPGRSAATGWRPRSPAAARALPRGGPAAGPRRRAGRASPTTAPACEVELPALPDTAVRRRRGQLHRPDDRRLPQHRPAAERARRAAAWSRPTRCASASPARRRARCSTSPARSCPGCTSSARPARARCGRPPPSPRSAPGRRAGGAARSRPCGPSGAPRALTPA